MFRSEQEEINTVIGEAALSLLDDFTEISRHSLCEKLKEMLKAEAGLIRRKLIIDAISQIKKLSRSLPRRMTSPEKLSVRFCSSLP